MREIQRFALENIYCAPHQDRQYTFNLVRVSKPNRPVKRLTIVYTSITKHLPDQTNQYHTYLIGNLNPGFINLLKQNKDWYRDSWTQVSSDMVERDYILQLYNQDGVMFPRANIYYMFMDESSILFAIKLDLEVKRHFDVESFKFLRVYSNRYFTTSEYMSLPVKHGIKHHQYLVNNNTNKVAVQTKIAEYKQQGGDVTAYVNGLYTENVTLNLPTPSIVEFVYDQSIISKEKYPLSKFRTFMSVKDTKLKFLLHRDKVINRIQYEDDNEIYITNNKPHTTGLYFYQHKDFVVRNVTDKDYSLYTQYVNNQAAILSTKVGGATADKFVTIYTRKSGLSRELKYSSLKLHELYKLPKSVQLDVLTNHNYTISDYRAETLENSDYFKLASVKNISQVSNDLSRKAIGYNGIAYYYGKTPTKITKTTPYVDVPLIYQTDSTAYEYNDSRIMIGRFPTQGPAYIPSNNTVRHVEFIRGTESNSYGSLYSKGETISLRNFEYRLLLANFQGSIRQTEWLDVTTNEDRVTIVNQEATLNLSVTEKIKVLYQDNPLMIDIKLPITQGVMYFPITYREDRGNGLLSQPLDYYPETLEVFLNGKRLNYNLDYLLDLPHINIVNKSYIDYTKEKQDIHIRVRGVVSSPEETNQHEIRGFVNNGVLGRNNVYDIRDDRVFSIYVGGKIYCGSSLKFAEEDNTVRLDDPSNGLPYTLAESMIPLYDMTGLDTTDFYNENSKLNTRIADLYDLIYPEPNIDEFNIISDHHYLYSPVIAKILHAVINKVIPESLYSNPYDDSVIFDLLSTPEYKLLHKLDPVRLDLPDNLIEIHPHPGNTTINLNLHQYRFITNVVRVLTNHKPERVNLSGYLTLSN